MKLIRLIIAPVVAGLLFTSPVHADTLGTAIGGGVGAVAGAMIGDSVGGRNAMLIGSGVGGALGAVVGQSVSRSANPQYSGYYDDDYGRQARTQHIHHHHYHGKKRHGHGHAYGHYKNHRHGWHD